MGKGRDKQLIAERNEMLLQRYYYWTEVKRLRFDDTIAKLSREEFFISESRIMQVIRGMIQAGATVDGKVVERPLFTGFRVRPKSSPSGSGGARQLSLFADDGQ
jgi:hypothetical protein